MTKKNFTDEGTGKKKNNNKKLQDQVNKEEIGNLSEKEYKVMKIKTFSKY